MNAAHESQVTMAIAPTSHGFGYVMFDNPDLLIDWGVKDVRKNKMPDSLLKARVLMHILQPEVLVVEDAHHSSSRRSKRVRELIDQIADLAKDKGIAVARSSRHDVLTIFGRVGAQSKDDIAGAVAKVLPELAPRLPRRRIWESEHYSMAIFEAAALGLTHFARSEDKGGSETETKN
jgi:ribosomal protein L17